MCISVKQCCKVPFDVNVAIFTQPVQQHSINAECKKAFGTFSFKCKVSAQRSGE